jgi:hypothetical protein
MYWRFVCCAVVVGLASLAAASAAFAHASYERSNPSPGAVVPVAPTVVEIFTAQDLRRSGAASEITVEDERGVRVDNGDTRIDDTNRRHFMVTLKPDLPPGRYVVRFRTLSDEDGEADSGAFAFYVGTQPTEAQRAQDAQLRLTESEAPKTPLAPQGGGSSRTAVLVGAVAVVALVALGLVGWLALRRRPAQG